MRKILSCHLHDTIEVACLYGFEVCLQLKNQKKVQGKAITTQTTSEKKEYLLLLVDDQNVQVDLTDILTMQAVKRNPHFDVVEF